MLIRVNPTSERPIYAQIADSVRVDMARERILPGTVLPPAREVAGSLGINVHTVLHAYQSLRDEGLLDLRRGRGAVVTEAAMRVSELEREVRALVARAAALGVAADTLAALVADAAGAGAVADPGAAGGGVEAGSRPAAAAAADPPFAPNSRTPNEEPAR